MTDELRRLTWKYFWQRKKEEIKDFFEENWKFFAVIMVAYGLLAQLAWLEPELPNVFAIIGLYLIGFWVLVGLIALIFVTCKWLKSNWELASEDAQEELNSSGKN